MKTCGDSSMVEQDLFQSQDGGLIPTSPLQFIYPDKITIKQVDIGTIVKLQKVTSKTKWRPAPGRKISFIVYHGDIMLGIIILVSPVISLGVRDNFLKLKKENRGKKLRNYIDMSGCVGIQPISWHWNIGKLLAMLALTLGDYVKARYPDDEFLGITTTSIWGKSTQYNKIYKFIGYTKGYGHEHISDEEYKRMIEKMKEHGIEIPSCKFGAGSNARMRRISAYKKAFSDKSVTLVHGKKRGVYYQNSIPPENRKKVIAEWYEKYGLPRYLKTKEMIPPYNNGLEGRAA